MTLLNDTITSWIDTNRNSVSTVGDAVYTAISSLVRVDERKMSPHALQDRAFLFVDAYGTIMDSRPNAPWSVRDDQTRYNDLIFAGTDKMKDPSTAAEDRGEVIAVIAELEGLIADNLPTST